MGTLQITYEQVRGVALGDPLLQTFEVADNGAASPDAVHEALWSLVQGVVVRMAPEETFGKQAEEAQAYLAAHLISLAFQNNNGVGGLASESIGGISRSWTVPYLNRKDVWGSTQYGMMFLSLKTANILPFAVIGSRGF